MHKRKLDKFRDKFSLLNSQKSDEEILWSSNDSSDYETVSTTTIKSANRKQYTQRKRKKNVLKNISNLNISFLDLNKSETQKLVQNSPILNSKPLSRHPISPVISPSGYFPPYYMNKSTSPIISAKRFCQQSSSTSPILKQRVKMANSPQVRKKLFECKTDDKIVEIKRSASPILRNNCEGKYAPKDSQCKKSYNIENKINSTKIFDQLMNVENSNKIVNKKRSTLFMENFSSENSTQYSISDNTPRDCHSSEDYEDTNSLIEIVNNSTLSIKIEDNISPESTVYFNETTKIRYKKNGLAYRFNALLKKHNASVSLWQHERFMAENSDFVVPKTAYKAFRIQKVDIQYGCYLLKAMDQDDNNFLILLPCSFVQTCHNLRENTIFKLYEPYKILQYNNFCKLVINVYKFECKVTI